MSSAQRSPVKKSLFVILIGDPTETLLENRVLNATLLLVLVTGVLSMAQNLIMKNSLEMFLSSFFSALAGIIGYWISRCKRGWKMLSIPIFVFFLIVLAGSWITQAGTLGGIGYYFFLLLTTSIVVFRGAGKVVSLGVTVFVLVGLLAVEAFKPEFLRHYPNTLQRFTDVAFSMLFCLMMGALMFYVVYREYQRERKVSGSLLRQVTTEKEAAEQNLRQKQRLLSIVSHDIANALFVAQGSIALVREHFEKVDERASLERMEFALNNISEIINSIRMLEAVQQGRIPLALENVRLEGIFDTVQAIFKDKLAQRNLTLVFPGREAMQRAVIAEPRLLANHVISNLLSNAIRFSYPDSRICIGIGSSGKTTSISVIDSGIGIPEALLARLFDPNARTSRPGTLGDPGTGFGLLTAKSFVELFGGRIEAVSKSLDVFPKDHGTTVTVTLRSAFDTTPDVSAAVRT